MKMTIWVWASDLVHALFEGTHGEHYESKEEAERKRVIRPGLARFKISIERDDK